jgi:site-specific DNA-methyltransferase (adenine-specific)
MDFMADKPDNAYDLAIVDPPYGIGINKSGRLGHYGGKKKWDDTRPDVSYFNELFRVSKNQIIWGGNYFVLPECVCFLIWDKQQPPGLSFADGELAWTSFKSVARFFRLFPVNANKGTRIHPTEKPYELYRWLLKNYAKPGDKILDTHGGSMSIAIACHDMGFDLDLCELDKDYFEAGKKRYENHISQLRMC